MVTSPSLPEFKQHLDSILRHRLRFLGFFSVEPGVGLDDPCGFLETQDIL